ncbi:phosphatidate cytidylyltransferase [Sporosarcina sp. G11-34]|uniref:phosphatidate cytidylyltransferase n=1 Tax=Sporosarcina sp. G11-34 TaxID=2849605 RepID=UPI0022A97BE2|nr:phosphatidate cytidylyltransferase [Sporosarcina sp. G11-34]MCZ2258791.1 phosphatidate cytidylyltransferase [Sporosarcina sp. G11-34]
MKERILTAAVALALFVPLILVGGTPFTVAIYIMATIGLYEILRMKDLHLFSLPGLFTWIVLIVMLMPTNWSNTIYEAIGYTKFELMFAAILMLLAYTVLVKNRFTFDHVAFSILGALYIGIGFYYLIETRNFGIEYVAYAFIVIWMTDTGAYFTGRKIGKRKLWPEISPNKTIEGAVGGIVWAIVFACIFQYFLPVANSYLILIVVTIIASIVGQMGDLVESAIKRHYDVKDSGKLLPGHGGILDRFDSLLFVLPLLHLLHFVA